MKGLKGHPEVVAYLNELIGGELAARDQYFIHSRMYAEWGYEKLFERIDHEMDDETEHAHQLIRRVLILGGTPASAPTAVNIGSDVKEMLEKDLATELEVQKNLKAGIALCEKHSDYVTRDLLIDQLIDTEEDHAHWLEQQLYLIEQMGLQNYLQSQI